MRCPFWLEQTYPITVKMIHKIIRYIILEKSKTLGWTKLTKLTLAEWDVRSMKLNNVIDMEIKIGIHAIAHKIYFVMVARAA